MHNAIRRVGVAAAGLTATATLAASIGAVFVTPGAVAAPQATSTAALNVRSGPGTQYRVVGALNTGQKVTVAGAARAGWLPVQFGGQPAYVSARYVTVTDNQRGQAAAAASPIKGTRTTTAALNVRTGPGITHDIVTVINKGAKVSVTGVIRNGYTEIAYGGKNRWVSSMYLSGAAPSPAVPVTPKTTVGIATAELIIRSTPDAKFKTIAEVPAGTRLEMTGVVKGDRTQVLYKGVLRWVNANYIRPATATVTPGKLPKVTGYRYATVALDIRSASKNSYTLTEVPAGTKLPITGVTADGRTQVIYQNAARWVTSQYLSTTAGPKISSSSQGISGLRPSTKYLMSRLQIAFPQVVTYYGVRPDPIPDHPSGRALDAMLPSYNSASGRKLGRAIADWTRSNARALGVEYVIYDQKIWNVKRDTEGWRYMADRGGDTANHKDHVHVTMLN